MDFVDLKLRNFLSLSAAEVDFSPGLALVSGINHDMSFDEQESNGAGKTAIFSGVHYALWGKLPVVGAKADSVVNRVVGGDCEVHLRWRHGPSLYEVSRYRRHSVKGNAIEFHKDGVDLTRHRDSDTEAAIAEAIPISQDVWSYGVMVGQGMPHKFLSLSETAKQDLLFSIVDISMYDNAKSYVSKEASPILSEVATTRSLIASRNEQVLALDVERAKWEKDLRELGERGAEQGVTAASSDIELLSQRLKSFGEEKTKILSDLDILSSGLPVLQAAVESANKAYYDKYNRQGTLTTERASVEGQLSRLCKLEGSCPTCLQPVNEESLAAVSKELTETLCTLEEEYKSISAEVVTLKAELDKAVAALNHQNSSIQANNLRLSGITLEEAKSRTKLESLSTIVAEHANKVREIGGRIQYITDSASVIRASITELESKRVRLEREHAHYDYWDKCIPKLRSSTVTDVLAYLNERLEQYMEALSGGVLGMRLIQEAYGAGSRIKTELRTPGESYIMSSGGEKRRVDVALYMAISDLIKSSAGVSCNLMVADEITDGLSSAGVHRFLDLLRARAVDGMCVMVVTHNASVLQALPFDRVYQVEKRGGVATCSCMNFSPNV